MSVRTISSGTKKEVFPVAALWTGSSISGMTAPPSNGPSVQLQIWPFPLIGMPAYGFFYSVLGPPTGIVGKYAKEAVHPYSSVPMETPYAFCSDEGVEFTGGQRLFKKQVIHREGTQTHVVLSGPGSGYHHSGTWDREDVVSYVVGDTQPVKLDSPLATTAGYYGLAWFGAAKEGWQQAYNENNRVGYDYPPPEETEAAWQAMLAANATWSATEVSISFDWEYTYYTNPDDPVATSIESGSFSETRTLSEEDTFDAAVSRAEAHAAAGFSTAPLSGSSFAYSNGDGVFVRPSNLPAHNLWTQNNSAPYYHSLDTRKAVYVLRYRHVVSAPAVGGTQWAVSYKVKKFSAGEAIPEFYGYPYPYDLVHTPFVDYPLYPNGLPKDTHPFIQFSTVVTETWLDLIPGGWRDLLGYPSNEADAGWNDMPWFDRWLPARTTPAASYGSITSGLQSAGRFFKVRIVALDGKAGWKAKLKTSAGEGTYTYNPDTEEYEYTPPDTVLFDLGTTETGGEGPAVFITSTPADDDEPLPELTIDSSPLIEITDPDDNEIDPSKAGAFLKLEFLMREGLLAGRHESPAGDFYERKRTTTTKTATAFSTDFTPKYMRHMEAWTSTEIVELDVYDKLNYISFSAALDGAAYDVTAMMRSGVSSPFDVGSSVPRIGEDETVEDGGSSRTTTTTWTCPDFCIVVMDTNRPGFAGSHPAHSVPGTSGYDEDAIPDPSATVMSDVATLSGGTFATPYKVLVVKDTTKTVLVSRGWAVWSAGSGASSDGTGASTGSAGAGPGGNGGPDAGSGGVGAGDPINVIIGVGSGVGNGVIGIGSGVGSGIIGEGSGIGNGIAPSTGISSSGGISGSGEIASSGGISGSGGITASSGISGSGGITGSGGIIGSGGMSSSGGISGSGGIASSGGI